MYIRCFSWFGIICTILKNVKITHGGMSLLGKLQAYFTKSKNPPLVFFTFLELYKWYQIVQRILILTASDRVILDTVLKYTFKAVKPFLTTQTKRWICQCFLRLSRNAILEYVFFKSLQVTSYQNEDQSKWLKIHVFWSCIFSSSSKDGRA